MSFAAQLPRKPSPAEMLPVIPAGKVPDARLAQAHNLANQLVSLENLKNKAPGNPMGIQGKMGGRTRRRFKKKRLMSHKYCKKTPCRHMGFTQKASCRPYKNCFTRRR